MDQTPHVVTGASHPTNTPTSTCGWCGAVKCHRAVGSHTSRFCSQQDLVHKCLSGPGWLPCAQLQSCHATTPQLGVVCLFPRAWGSRGQPLPRQVTRASCPAPQDAYNTELVVRLPPSQTESSWASAPTGVDSHSGSPRRVLRCPRGSARSACWRPSTSKAPAACVQCDRRCPAG